MLSASNYCPCNKFGKTHERPWRARQRFKMTIVEAFVLAITIDSAD